MWRWLFSILQECKMSKRRNTLNPVAPNGVITIGLDIGYGVVKAVTSEAVITFPSVAGHAREIKFQQAEIAQRHPGDQISDDEGDWFVGDLALAQLPPGELLRLRGRTANEAAMGNLFRLGWRRSLSASCFRGWVTGMLSIFELPQGCRVTTCAMPPNSKSRCWEPT